MIVSTQESSKEIKAPKELEPYLNIQTDKEGKIGITILDSKILGEKYTLEFMRLVKEVSILNHHNNLITVLAMIWRVVVQHMKGSMSFAMTVAFFA